MSLVVFPIKLEYEGATRSLEVDPHERIAQIVIRAAPELGIPHPPPRIALYFEDGSEVDPEATAEGAGLKPNVRVLLRHLQPN